MFPKNPFVILQLPANATSAEIRAAGQKAIATMRLESSQNISAIREVEGAIEALRDPVLRFTTGLHWISLGSEAAKLLQLDPEFEKLSERPRIDRGPAIDRLLKDEIKHCKDHGQAVFSLMRAYALLSSKPSNDEISKGTKLLGVGIAAWIRATNAPEFWLAQRFRAREINDPRVGAELIKKSEESAIETVFQPFIELLIESLRAHNGQLCKSIVEVLMNCNVDKSTTDRLMGQVFEQFCRNLEGVVSLLATRLKSIKAADRVAPFQDLFDDYLAQVDPKIDLLLFIGDLPGTSEERVRDAAASFLRNLAVYSANSAKAYKFSTGVLTFADKAAYSKSIRCELVEIAKIFVNNQKNVDSDGDAEGELKRKHALLTTVASALVRSDYKTALKILDEIIALNPAGSVEERNRRAHIATLWATQLYNSGISQVNAGYSAAGQSFLEEAASIESNPTELAKINRALNAVRGGAQKLADPQTSRRNPTDASDSASLPFGDESSLGTPKKLMDISKWPSMPAPWSSSDSGEAWVWGDFVAIFQTKPISMGEQLLKIVGRKDISPRPIQYPFAMTMFYRQDRNPHGPSIRPILVATLERMDYSALGLGIEGAALLGLGIRGIGPVVKGLFDAEGRYNLGQFEGELTPDSARKYFLNLVRSHLPLVGEPVKIGVMIDVFGHPNTGWPPNKKSKSSGCISMLAILFVVVVPFAIFTFVNSR